MSHTGEPTFHMGGRTLHTGGDGHLIQGLRTLHTGGTDTLYRGDGHFIKGGTDTSVNPTGPSLSCYSYCSQLCLKEHAIQCFLSSGQIVPNLGQKTN